MISSIVRLPVFSQNKSCTVIVIILDDDEFYFGYPYAYEDNDNRQGWMMVWPQESSFTGFQTIDFYD